MAARLLGGHRDQRKCPLVPSTCPLFLEHGSPSILPRPLSNPLLLLDPQRLGASCPVSPKAFPESTTAGENGQDRSGLPHGALSSGKQDTRELCVTIHPRRPQSTPAPHVYPHRPCGPASLAIRPSLPRTGLGAGARAPNTPNPCPSRSGPGAQESAQRFTERKIRVLAPKPERWGKGRRERVPRVPRVTGPGLLPAGPA